MSVEAAFGRSPGEKGEQICPSQPTTGRLRCQKMTAGGEEAIKEEETRYRGRWEPDEKSFGEGGTGDYSSGEGKRYGGIS